MICREKNSFDAVHAIAHNKVTVIDKAIAISASFNHMKAEQNDAVNQLVLKSKDIAWGYIENVGG